MRPFLPRSYSIGLFIAMATTTQNTSGLIYSLRQRGLALLPFTLALFIFLWYALVWAGDLRAFILPTPDLVLSRFIQAAGDGSLLRHTLVTLGEVLGGLVLGVSVATLLGYLLAKSHTLERLLSPYIVASQSIPNCCDRPLVGDLVRAGVDFQGADLCLDCLLSNINQYNCRYPSGAV